LRPQGFKKIVLEDDIFTINLKNEIVEPYKNVNLILSECTPLFLEAFKLLKAGAS
jgi:hypothetical protein